MEKNRLGRTGLMAGRVGFGALPIQRIDRGTARKILLKAYDNGINFFDTARGYSDSEEKIGFALSEVRSNIIIASKTGASDRKMFFLHLEQSLKDLKTDYIDIYQLHNPKQLPDEKEYESAYNAAVEAKKKGLIRFIGLSNHKLEIAREAMESGLYDTIQFPCSLLSAESEIELAKECGKKDIGFIAMKALSGGLLSNISAAFAFIWQFDNVIPIWGIQKETELDEFLALADSPPEMSDELQHVMEGDRRELAGSFCRGCGYCMPCPVGIPINIAARISLLLKRAPREHFLTDEIKSKMLLIDECTECGQCKSKCPYDLDTPALLKSELEKYMKELNSGDLTV